MNFPFSILNEVIYWENRTPVSTESNSPIFTIISLLIEHPNLPSIFACVISYDSWLKPDLLWWIMLFYKSNSWKMYVFGNYCKKMKKKRGLFVWNEKNRTRIMLNEHLHLKIAFNWSEGPSFILKPCSSPWFERGSFHTSVNLNGNRGLFHILQSLSQTYLFCLEAWKVVFPINKFKRLCSSTQFSSPPAWSEPICEYKSGTVPSLAVLVPRKDKWVLCYHSGFRFQGAELLRKQIAEESFCRSAPQGLPWMPSPFLLCLFSNFSPSLRRPPALLVPPRHLIKNLIFGKTLLFVIIEWEPSSGF